MKSVFCRNFRATIKSSSYDFFHFNKGEDVNACMPAFFRSGRSCQVIVNECSPRDAFVPTNVKAGMTEEYLTLG